MISSLAAGRGMGKGMSTGESPEVQSDAKRECNGFSCDAHLENKENAFDFAPARQAVSPYISVRIGGLVIEFCNKPRFLHAAACLRAAAGIVAKVRYGA
ncbi:hypothetical protein ACIQBJ_08260 [Kitasatospora sp. NPDC088391]|uniref:hypothetical protein n=1 Tax=Kitasatospora sp. NPDC088391 TaxID=3364074 RepID=UPI003816D924